MGRKINLASHIDKLLREAQDASSKLPQEKASGSKIQPPPVFKPAGRVDTGKSVAAQPEKAAKKQKRAREETIEISGSAEAQEVQAGGAKARLFSPRFDLGEGKTITNLDSLGEDPNLGPFLLEGVALPKDMKQLPRQAGDNLSELCWHLAKGAQNAYRGYQDMTQLIAEYNILKEERSSFEQKAKEQEARVLELRKCLRKKDQEKKDMEHRLKRQEDELGNNIWLSSLTN